MYCSLGIERLGLVGTQLVGRLSQILERSLGMISKDLHRLLRVSTKSITLSYCYIILPTDDDKCIIPLR